MEDIKIRVQEVLHNLNWLMEPHNSYAELVEITGRKVIIRCIGTCVGCETDCIGTAFKERMPDVELVLQ